MKRIIMSVGAIVFVVAAAAGATGAFFSDSETSTGNVFTAGALDLKIDSQQHYAGLECSEVTAGIFQWIQDPDTGTTTRPELIGTPCTGTWSLTDLGPANQFFNFTDLKPGDPGENTISLHVDNNAWACIDIHTDGNNDNDVNEPEIGAGDNASSTEGELAQNVSIFGWLDNASTSGAVPGDNIHQAGEATLFSPVPLMSLSATTTLTLADGGTGTPLPGGSTSFIGLAWCVGSTTIGGGGAISCDGSTVDNIIQTDSASSTIIIRAEQARNNPNFDCTPNVVDQLDQVN